MPENRRVEGVGNSPQDDRERDQIGRGSDRLDGVVVDADVAGIDAGPGAVDEAADVLRDALIGVVGWERWSANSSEASSVRIVRGV